MYRYHERDSLQYKNRYTPIPAGRLISLTASLVAHRTLLIAPLLPGGARMEYNTPVAPLRLGEDRLFSK
jgi:hypothetical protein